MPFRPSSYFNVGTDAAQRAIGYFENVPTGDRPVHSAVCGLRLIAHHAARHAEFGKHVQHLESAAAAVIFAATPIVAKLVWRDVSAEQVYFGMGSAAALFRPEDVFKPDRINVVGMLEAQLWLQFNRQEMAARGNPLFRAFAIDRRWKSPRNPDLPLQ